MFLPARAGFFWWKVLFLLTCSTYALTVVLPFFIHATIPTNPKRRKYPIGYNIPNWAAQIPN